MEIYNEVISDLLNSPEDQETSSLIISEVWGDVQTYLRIRMFSATLNRFLTKTDEQIIILNTNHLTN